MVIRVVVLSLLLAGCAQNAAQPTAMADGTTSATSAAAAAPQEKKVCRADTELGSIMSKRICHTPTEWAAIDAANSQNAQRALEDRQRGAAERQQ